MTKTRVEREALSIGKAVFESVLIVVSVVMGFVISERGAHAKERELAANVRRNVALEVAENLKTIEPQIARHTAALAALDRVKPSPGEPALQIFFENLGGDMGEPMKRAAWDGAVSSGALRVLDQDLVDRYSQIHVDQERVYDEDPAWLKTALYRPENFDPAQQKVAFATLRAARTGGKRGLHARSLPQGIAGAAEGRAVVAHRLNHTPALRRRPGRAYLRKAGFLPPPHHTGPFHALRPS